MIFAAFLWNKVIFHTRSLKACQSAYYLNLLLSNFDKEIYPKKLSTKTEALKIISQFSTVKKLGNIASREVLSLHSGKHKLHMLVIVCLGDRYSEKYTDKRWRSTFASSICQQKPYKENGYNWYLKSLHAYMMKGGEAVSVRTWLAEKVKALRKEEDDWKNIRKWNFGRKAQRTGE